MGFPARLFVKYGRDIFYTEQGVVKKRKVDRLPYFEVEFCPEFKEMLRNLGFAGSTAASWVPFLRKSEGESEEVIFDEVKKRIQRRIERREQILNDRSSMVSWRRREFVEFNGMVIGFNKSSFMQTDRDFSFAVSLRSCPFDEQVKFVRANSKKLIEYAKESVQEYYKFKRHIGSFDYYYLSDMIVTRDSQVRFVFSIRKEIEAILSGEEKED